MPVSSFINVGGIKVSTTSREKFIGFEKNYLTLREKEKRVLDVEEVRKLPYVSKDNPDFKLWEIRRKNIDRFLKYLSKKNASLHIIDIGCGNGFFSHMMSEKNHRVSGIDINLHELKIVDAAFKNENLDWYCLDFLNEWPEHDKADLITFCGSFQYFPDPVKLLTRCLDLLNEKGEIHIIDSPFYTSQTHASAKKASLDHFKTNGVPAMSDYYHHHTSDILTGFDFSYMYRPRHLLNKLLRIMDSPFPWIRIHQPSKK